MNPQITQGSILVRLTDVERIQIRNVIQKISTEMGFDWVCISLFGSRVDLTKRGGDIDLYIKIKYQPYLDLHDIKRKVRLVLCEQLGEQKFDIIIDDSFTELGAFGELIKNQKVDLWMKN